MADWLNLLLRAASLRTLLFGLVAVGVLASQSAPGTLAFFTSTTSSSAVFASGVLNVTLTPSGTQTASFGWTTSGKGSNCRVISGAGSGTTAADTALQGQAFAPNEDCTAKLAINNPAGAEKLAANVRARLIRYSTTAPTTASNALNDVLKVYVAELKVPSASDATCSVSGDFIGDTANWTVLTAVNNQTIGGTGLAVTDYRTTEPTSANYSPSENVATSGSGGGRAGRNLWGTDASEGLPGPGTSSEFQLAPGASKTLCFRVELPLATANTAQGGTNNYSVVVDAVQAAGR